MMKTSRSMRMASRGNRVPIPSLIKVVGQAHIKSKASMLDPQQDNLKDLYLEKVSELVDTNLSVVSNR